MNISDIISREIWSLNENAEDIQELTDIIDLNIDNNKSAFYKKILKDRYGVDYVEPNIRNKELIDFVSKIRYKKSGITNKNLPITIEVYPNEYNGIEIMALSENNKPLARSVANVNLKEKTLDISNSLVYGGNRRLGIYSFIVDEFYSIAKRFGLRVIEKKSVGRSQDAKEFWKSRIGESYFTDDLNEDVANVGRFDLNEFDKLRSFSARKRYADNTLRRISAGGSSRIVYEIDNDKVLKLAANQKGLAQNSEEASIGVDNFYNAIVAKVYDSHPDDLWVVSEKARKATPSDIKKYIGVSLDNLSDYLYKYSDHNNRGFKKHTLSDEIVNILNENNFVQTLITLMNDYMPIGDLGRISSYGVTNREGVDVLILIDYGLTYGVLDTHYRRRYNEDAVYDGGYAGFALVSDNELVGEDFEYYHATDAKPENDKYELGIETINENDILQLNELPFINKLESIGGKVYSVGGAVRDEFLGKKSKDLDILVTGVSLENLEAILNEFGRVDAVGKSFGILKFKPEGYDDDIDVAIPRKEKSTGVGGHKGFDVVSDHNLAIEDDLYRRDFTINAIAKDIHGNIIDPYNGTDDLRNKIIRLVNPDAFSDDPLRMLRAVQFASRFGFKIEPNTLKNIKSNANRINEISPERILIEFDKIIKKGDIFNGVFLLKSTGLLKNIFGADSGIYMNGKYWDNVKTMGEFIWGIGHNLVNDIAKFYKTNLKGDINTTKEIASIDYGYSNVTKDVARNRLVSSNMVLTYPYIVNSKVLPNEILSALHDINTRYPIGLKELKVNGNDLMKLGLKGDEIGNTLKKILYLIYSDKLVNEREDILNFLNKKNTNIEESDNKYKILYSGIVLDDNSRNMIYKLFKKFIPSDWEFIGHHMTINLGELNSENKKNINKRVDLTVNSIAWDDKVIALGVDGYNVTNKHPHVTLAVNRHNGGSPKMSNDLKIWNKLKNKIKISGIVEEIGTSFSPIQQIKEEKVSIYDRLERSKKISREMKDQIKKYLNSSSNYNDGIITGLRIPKINGKSFDGVSMGADKDGFFVYTHRARSKSFDTPKNITDKSIKFIETTG